MCSSDLGGLWSSRWRLSLGRAGSCHTSAAGNGNALQESTPVHARMIIRLAHLGSSPKKIMVPLMADQVVGCNPPPFTVIATWLFRPQNRASP